MPQAWDSEAAKLIPACFPHQPHRLACHNNLVRMDTAIFIVKRFTAGKWCRIEALIASRLFDPFDLNRVSNYHSRKKVDWYRETPTDSEVCFLFSC